MRFTYVGDGDPSAPRQIKLYGVTFVMGEPVEVPANYDGIDVHTKLENHPSFLVDDNVDYYGTGKWETPSEPEIQLRQINDDGSSTILDRKKTEPVWEAEEVKVSEKAKNLARRHKIDLDLVKPNKLNRIGKPEIERYLRTA